MKSKLPTSLQDGDQCTVMAGTHSGKSGTIRDINLSKTGHITITVVQKNGVRFKTLGRNVVVTPEKKQVKPATKPEQIQTLHPQPGKTNKRISLEKYNTIKETLLSILQKKAFTHTELMEELYSRVKDSFEGGVQWYGETVKLDLEARKIIERTETKPEKYQIINKKQKS